MKDLVPIEDANPSELFAPGGLDELLSMIEREATATVFDVETSKGRKAIASTAMKVARSKTYIDGMGKDFVGKLKEQTKVIDAERRKAREFLEDLKAKVRKPLNDWEQKEVDRVADLRTRLDAFAPNIPEVPTATQIAEIFSGVEAITVDDSWQEFQEQAQTAKDAMLFRLGKLHDELDVAEKAAAKAEADRKEREAQERKEREERIAKEAAEQAKRDAEVKAKEEADRVERARIEAENEARAQREKLERERKQAIKDAQAAEAARIEAARKMKEGAERAAKQAEIDRASAAIRAKIEAEEAVISERKRIEAEHLREKQEADRREADKRHRGKIHSAMAQALVAEGLTEEQAKRVVVAIASHRIPHCSIGY